MHCPPAMEANNSPGTDEAEGVMAEGSGELPSSAASDPDDEETAPLTQAPTQPTVTRIATLLVQHQQALLVAVGFLFAVPSCALWLVAVVLIHSPCRYCRAMVCLPGALDVGEFGRW